MGELRHEHMNIEAQHKDSIVNGIFYLLRVSVRFGSKYP